MNLSEFAGCQLEAATIKLVELLELSEVCTMTPAWYVIQWPVVRMTPVDWAKTVTSLRRYCVFVDEGTAGSATRGQILLGTRVGNARVGVAWEWCTIRNTIVVMADPMSILSNLALVDDTGEPVLESTRLRILNDAIYATDWQRALLKERHHPMPIRPADHAVRVRDFSVSAASLV